MESWDDADAHFRHAIDFNTQLGALPWLAHTRFQYASMLRQRKLPGDAARARQQLQAAGAEASRLGMASLVSRVQKAGGDA
jgi:hypothetical protein